MTFLRSLFTPKLLRVGYWRERPYLPGSTLLAQVLELTGVGADPKVEDHIDPSWDPAERAIVLDYLAPIDAGGEGRVHESWYGFSTCRLCGRENGSRDMTDDVWVWPEGLAHYLRDHQVKPPDTFVRYVLPSRHPRPRRGAAR